MRLGALIAAVSWWLCAVEATSDNLTDLVTWDKYSLLINGSRVFINSGEFHYQRLPVPELWLDIFQKFKANGFNTVSIYFFWSYHSPSPDVYDFTTAGKNLQKLFDTAKEAGLWVVCRAGPYINAETTGGGQALWGSDGSLGMVRSGDEQYHQAWLPWIHKVGAIIAKNQITNGGPVILNQVENEYNENVHEANDTRVIYMEQLKKAFREAGIVVPLTHNEAGMSYQSWSTDYEDVGGAVNIYGLDNYPGGLDCLNPQNGFEVVRDYFQWFSNYSFTQPSYMPEFEGGWFSDWGGTFYDQCTSAHDPAFPDIYYKNNVGQRVTLLSIYMTYGGTNWGHSAAPFVYTSYDYTAGIRETRQLWNKLYQTKLLYLFTSSAPDLLKTEMVGNGTGFRVSSDTVWTWVLQNPDSKASFMVLQQASTSSTGNVSVSVDFETSEGTINVPDVALTGRQSKLLVTDYAFGKHTLLYSSAEVLTHLVFDDADILVFYLKAGHTGQFALKGDSDFSYAGSGSAHVRATKADGRQDIVYTQTAGSTVLKLDNGVLVYLLEQQTAWKFWAPPSVQTPYPSPDERLLILGPYLVRNANITGSILYVSGDNDNSTTLEVYVGSTALDALVWNGQRIAVTKTAYGSYTAKIPGAEGRTISLPSLTNWRSADSLPESKASFDDSRWAVCNKTTTPSLVAPLSLPVLFSSDYGYYTGAKVYRGYFDGKNITSVQLDLAGGYAFGWNAWLNGAFAGGFGGDGNDEYSSVNLTLPASSLQDSDNVLTVLVDCHGHDETNGDTPYGVEMPRGILGAVLLPSGTANATGFKLWKIQGNAGGPSYLDPVRGPMNEGGLYYERMGWALPGFDPPAASFDTASPQTGLSAAGVRFYRTTFELAIDDDLDVPIGVDLSAPEGTVARILLWVNGYQYGKYEPHIGPQTRFPIPPGILNNRGNNTLGLGIWAQTDAGAKLDQVKLVSYGAYHTDFGFARDFSALQPGWTDRSPYA